MYFYEVIDECMFIVLVNDSNKKGPKKGPPVMTTSVKLEDVVKRDFTSLEDCPNFLLNNVTTIGHWVQ